MSTKLFALTSLLALAAARPTILERRADRSDCWQTNPGTTFYSCANGYIGCFYQDPCSLPALLDTPSPTPTPSPPPPAPTTHEQTTPRSFNIYPASAAQHNDEDPVPHIDLQKRANSPISTTNALVFDAVPAGAKNCALKWRSTVPSGENAFTVAGSGMVWHRQLLGFPSGEEKVSFNGLKKYQDPAAEWVQSMDFTGWTETPRVHPGPTVACGEVVAVELRGSEDGEGENRVFITETATNGVYLTYEL